MPSAAETYLINALEKLSKQAARVPQKIGGKETVEVQEYQDKIKACKTLLLLIQLTTPITESANYNTVTRQKAVKDILDKLDVLYPPSAQKNLYREKFPDWLEVMAQKSPNKAQALRDLAEYSKAYPQIPFIVLCDIVDEQAGGILSKGKLFGAGQHTKPFLQELAIIEKNPKNFKQASMEKMLGKKLADVQSSVPAADNKQQAMKDQIQALHPKSGEPASEVMSDEELRELDRNLSSTPTKTSGS